MIDSRQEQLSAIKRRIATTVQTLVKPETRNGTIVGRCSRLSQRPRSDKMQCRRRKWIGSCDGKGVGGADERSNRSRGREAI